MNHPMVIDSQRSDLLTAPVSLFDAHDGRRNDASVGDASACGAEAVEAAARAPRWLTVALAVWRFVESCGHVRAACELERLAQQYQHVDPELAARMRGLVAREA